MALEDLAMMRAQPNIAVLYPCDGVSTEQLVERAGGRIEGEHEGSRLGLRGELVPLPSVAEPEVVHPSGQHHLG